MLWLGPVNFKPSTPRALDGDVVVIEKLTSEDVADSLERADKRLRRDVADGDFGKTEAQLSTTVTWFFALKMASQQWELGLKGENDRKTNWIEQQKFNVIFCFHDHGPGFFWILHLFKIVWA